MQRLPPSWAPLVLCAPAVLIALLCLLLCSPVSAQIYAVQLKPDFEKKYAKSLVEINGQRLLLGEARSGIQIDPQTGAVQYAGNGNNELFQANPLDPSSLPYKYKNGARVEAGKKGVLTIQGEHIARVFVHLQEQSLAGLALEYERRLEELKVLAGQLAQATKGGARWFSVQQQQLAARQRLATWLAATAFPEAALKLRKELEQQQAVGLQGVLAERAAQAKASPQTKPTPPELDALAAELVGAGTSYGLSESLHLRIWYPLTRISHEQARSLLEFGEELIEGFRARCVDPYRDEAFQDRIPDGLFDEFFFVPDQALAYEQFLTRWCGGSWGARKEQMLASPGLATTASRPSRRLDYWRLGENLDLQGVFAHRIGHALAQVHYAQSIESMSQDWLAEAVAFQLSLESLGRNSVTCLGFEDPSRPGYARPAPAPKQEGLKLVELGLRENYLALALERGPRLEQLPLRTLFELEQADIAKGWAFYAFVLDQYGIEGQRWLRATCEAARNQQSFLEQWRSASETLFTPPAGQNVFPWLDGRFKTWAQAQRSRR